MEPPRCWDEQCRSPLCTALQKHLCIRKDISRQHRLLAASGSLHKVEMRIKSPHGEGRGDIYFKPISPTVEQSLKPNGRAVRMCCGLSIRGEERAHVTANLVQLLWGGTVRGENLLTKLFHGLQGGPELSIQPGTRRSRPGAEQPESDLSLQLCEPQVTVPLWMLLKQQKL